MLANVAMKTLKETQLATILLLLSLFHLDIKGPLGDNYYQSFQVVIN